MNHHSSPLITMPLIINHHYIPSITMPLPSGNLLHSELENHHFLLMGKSTISMAIFHNYVSLPEGI